MTGLLFETSPEEPEKKKTKRPQAESAAVVAEDRPAEASFDVGPIEYMGRCDDEYVCADESCGCGAHDVVDGAPGRWRIQCFACGTIQTVASVLCLVEKPATEVARSGASQSGDFVFKGGIFDGLSIQEAWARPRGPDYVTWASAEHPRPAVREACKKWLADSGATR